MLKETLLNGHETERMIPEKPFLNAVRHSVCRVASDFHYSQVPCSLPWKPFELKGIQFDRPEVFARLSHCEKTQNFFMQFPSCSRLFLLRQNRNRNGSMLIRNQYLGLFYQSPLSTRFNICVKMN